MLNNSLYKINTAAISGHNGRGTGAVGKTIDEGTETIWLRNRVEWYLATKYNYVIIVDSEKDKLQTVVNKLRPQLRKTDLCIDIHFDSFINGTANGTSVYIPDQYTPDELERAESLLSVVTTVLGTKSKGVRKESDSQHKSLAMLSGFDCCNLLLEVCTISSAFDSAKYLMKREKLAEAIADWIYNIVK